jgi:hypothetical protein
MAMGYKSKADATFGVEIASLGGMDDTQCIRTGKEGCANSAVRRSQWGTCTKWISKIATKVVAGATLFENATVKKPDMATLISSADNGETLRSMGTLRCHHTSK